MKENSKKKTLKKQNGISMISLVIMIIVILILAAIIFGSSNRSIESTGRGIFVRELSLVQQATNEKKLDNQIYGTSEETTNKGFYKAKIKNPPMNFVSFSEDEIYGYVIDLSYTHVEDAERGHDYLRFATNIDSNLVEFGKDDVYIYDKEGNVFYAKGYGTDDGIYYSKDEIAKFGPEIISVNKTTAANQKSATITVEVKKVNDGNLTVTVGGENASKISTSPDGTTETFEITVYENKTYVIIAKEENSGATTATIEITELDVKTFVISFDANGGTNAPNAQQKTENVIMKLSTQIPTKVGSTFLGWNENPSATIATYMPGGEFVLDKNTTLFAIWKLGEERTYSVIYNANGGENAPSNVENISGEYTITSEVPTREGYGFLGWGEKTKNNDILYLAGDKITLTKNIMLYAIWEKGTYTVTVSTFPEGAGTVTGNTTKTEGDEVYVSTAPNSGFIFKNWSVKSGNVNLRNTTSQATSFTMPNANVEIVANYQVGKLSVKYNANKGSGTPVDTEVEYGKEIEITSMKPTRAGYDFLGWALLPDATTPTHTEGMTYTVKENVVFYAVWNTHLMTYTIKYDLNTGYGNTAGEIGKFVDQVKTHGVPTTIVNGGENEPYKKDWTFKGWSLAADSDDIVLRPGDTYNRDADLQLYAIWKDEMPPTVSLSTKQDANSTEVQIIANVHDEGNIAGYAWTMTNTLPSAWETTGVGGMDLNTEKTITEKGKNYFWVKDMSGNYTVQYITAYEIAYDANGGVNAPAKQFQAENTDLILSKDEPTRERHTFLGWSTVANPGKMESDVQFLPGAKLNLNSDTILRAVWGETFFKLSANSGVTQIDGQNIVINVTPSAYTGNITVSSADTEKATVSISNNVITIVPGTKIGDVEITVVEDREGTTEKILVTVNRGIRQLTLDKNEHTFTYGDPSVKIGFSYNGKETGVSARTNNSSVATATASGKTLTITPKNYGTATITLVLAQDDQYLEKTADLQVSVVKKVLTVLPDSGQSKVYDGTTNTPTLKFTYTGNTAGETPAFGGALTRAIGADVGTYEITLGNLALTNNGNFIATNYTLVFSSTKVYFEITPKRIIVPEANTPQLYDGTMKYGIAAGTDYTRGGEYQQTNAGTYTAIASLNDTKNFVWDDNGKTTARNIRWEITRMSLTDSAKITVDAIPDQVYTGSSITPIPVVKFNGKTLANGSDYSCTYTNNINVGTATVTITGKGNYDGTITRTFKITPATMKVNLSGYTGTFDNQNHYITAQPTWPTTGYTIYYGTTQLTSSNYTTAGSTTNPGYKNVGSYTVYVYIVQSNFKPYSGSAVVKINQKDIATNLTISGVTNKKYTGSAITQSITVKDNDQNRTLTLNTDYTVSYSNNINMGTATLTVTGKGNYTGSKSVNFSILGDTITISKSTEALVTSLTVSMSKDLSVTTLQYKIDSGSWTNYTGAITITKDCIVYAQSVHNGKVLGTNQITITNICEHSYTTVSCTTDSTCKYCGILKESKWGHNFNEKSNRYLKSAATCLNSAVYYYECSNSGCNVQGSNTYEVPPPQGHDFSSKTTTSTYLKSAATCTAKAVYYYKCSRCTAKGTNTYESGSVLQHSYTATSSYVATTVSCTTAATNYYACSGCGKQGTTTYVVTPAWGHKYDEKSNRYVASSATCVAKAKYYYECSNSGCTAKGTSTYEVGALKDHIYESNWITSKAANCIQTGTAYRNCTVCGGATQYNTLPINPSNHYSGLLYNDVNENIAATCTTKGRSVDRCADCKAIVYDTIIPATGHSYSAATCTKLATCSKCGGTTGSLAAHNYSKTGSTLGNCVTVGYINYKCTVCGGTTKTSTGTVSTVHTGQTYTSVIKYNSCTSNGSTGTYCSGCNVLLSTTTTYAYGHSYEISGCQKICKWCKNAIALHLWKDYGTYTACTKCGIAIMN